MWLILLSNWMVLTWASSPAPNTVLTPSPCRHLKVWFSCHSLPLSPESSKAPTVQVTGL